MSSFDRLMGHAEQSAEHILGALEDGRASLAILPRCGEDTAPADSDEYAEFVRDQAAAILLALELLSFDGWNLTAEYRIAPKGVANVGRGCWLVQHKPLTETERKAQR